MILLPRRRTPGTQEEILTDFPSLTREAIRACLSYAADRERILWSIPAA
jgi:uncharacterized protein (DUF433 family)